MDPQSLQHGRGDALTVGAPRNKMQSIGTQAAGRNV
jgi:hypothetical protein